MSHQFHKAKGFTLIEILVAVLVMALGLLGLAGLQANGLKNTQLAYNRSQAIHLAQDIADRIRANSDAVGTYADVNNNNQRDTTEAGKPKGQIVAACSTAAGCSKEQLAQTDMRQWHNSIADALPIGCGSVLRGTGVPGGGDIENGCGGKVPENLATSTQLTISINWDENNDGVVDEDDPNFMMSFEL
jgi:type IV pilus assembly protein PilV